MFIKFIGQFVFTLAMLQLIPVDAAQYEWNAEVDSVSASAGLTQTEVGLVTSSLPEAGDRELPNYPVKVDLDSYGIVTTAESALVQDAGSGMMLLAKHPYEERSIGSVTKLMTALVFLEQEPNLNEIVSLDPALDLIEGGRVYLAFYDGLTLEDVFAASIVGSDNTATEALVRFSGLTKDVFIARMNSLAIDLGMTSSSFTDPTGIDAGNRSTAQDLILLLEAAEQDELLATYMTDAQVTVEHLSGRLITIANTNSLLASYLNQGDFTITGGKTGFLPQAGYVLATTIEQDGNAVHVIVLGSDSKQDRVDEVKGLASWAFRVYQWPN